MQPPFTPHSPTIGAQRGADPRVIALEQKVAALEAKLEALTSAIKVDGSGVTIQSTGSIALVAQSTLSLKANASMTAQSAAVSITSAAMAEFTSGGIVAIRGALLRLNNATAPVVRVCDHVTPAGVMPGNPTILA